MEHDSVERKEAYGSKKFPCQSPIAGAALVGITGLDGTRLYGMPASVASVPPVGSPTLRMEPGVDALLPSLFRLYTSIDGQPNAFSIQRLAACRTALAVLNDQAQASDFISDPSAYMNAAGIINGTLDTSTLEYGLIAALANPQVRAAAISGDPIAFINEVMATGRSGNQPSHDYVPPVTFISTVAVLNAYVHMDAVVTLGVFAVSVAIAAVLIVAALGVVVAGVDETYSSPEVQLAAVLGGEKFAEDVAAIKATAAMQQVMVAIQNDRLTLPDGITKEQVLETLSSTLQRHMIASN